MNYLKKLFPLLSIIPLLSLHAQPNEERVPMLKLSNAFMYLNFQQINGPWATLSDYRRMAPKSEILNFDYSAYEETMVRNKAGNGGFDLTVGLKLRNREGTGYGTKWKLRAGVGYSVGVVSMSELRDQQNTLIDTIAGGGSGGPYYIDSVKTDVTEIRFNSDYLRFHISAITYTDQNARFSLYGGLGLYTTYAYNNALNIEFVEEKYIDGAPSNHPNYSNDERNRERRNTLESFNVKPEFGGAIYAPLGLDFRLGKAQPFWQKVHLFFEVQLGVDYSKISTLGYFLRPFGTTGLGLRIT